MATTIAPVATIQLPTASRVFHTSWCPDKDLLVIFSRVSHQEKMTLYKMQGSKKWEVSIQPSQLGKEDVDVVDVAWSPDVQSIAVVSNPALVTIHSIQNGQVERSIPITVPSQRASVTGLWWFREEKKTVGNGLPDIFKRGENITGSALAILKGLPLLDPIQDDTKPLTSSELFAFQGLRNRTVPTTTTQPASILWWPSLPTDLTAASIAANRPDTDQSFPEAEDEVGDTNVNSILAVADNLGHLHLFLEGSYPLGAVSIRSKFFPRSLYKLRDHLFAHVGPSSASGDPAVGLLPSVVQLPYLTGRHFRDVARVSSAARELLSYAIRVVKDMRGAWFGTETSAGARDLGQKFVQSVEARQANEFGQEEPHAMLDLTCLLTTGRTSDALLDYLASGQHMSERSMQRWETIMTDSLVRLRDLAEKRVAPACQRLHLLLQEVQGWAALPQYAVCNFKTTDVEFCLEHTATAIFHSSWLASTARKELIRFKEFMKWIRFEVGRATGTEDHHSSLRHHDILEVNEYLTSSLVVSPIDKWFVGPVARINRESIGVPSENATISTAIAKARAALDHWDQTVHSDVKPRDLSHIERNLDTLLQTLATRCQQMFDEAARATARSAKRVAEWEAAVAETPDAPQSAGGPSSSTLLIRERTVPDENKPDDFVQFLAVRPPHDGGRSYLCIVRLQQGLGALKGVPTIGVSVLECCASEEGSEESLTFDLLDFDFFDSEVLVIVYRPKDQQAARIATVGYANLIYHTIPSHEYVNGTTREALMGDVLARLTNGQLDSAAAPIIQSRTLSGCATGGVTLAVNGRVGRRVSCVLDEAGLTLEVLDMAGEEEDVELEEAEEEEGAEGSS